MARTSVFFNASKDELMLPRNGYKILHETVLAADCDVRLNTGPISKATLTGANVAIFGGPREKFSKAELSAISAYVEAGGAAIVFLGEGGENTFPTNINYFLEEYGLRVNADSVIRTAYQKFLKPKEVLVEDGMLNREIVKEAGRLRDKARAASKAVRSQSASDSRPASAAAGSAAAAAEEPAAKGSASQVPFVLPFGATLSVDKPASALLSTGHYAFPLNRPVCALTESAARGRVIAVSSCALLSDAYIRQECNTSLVSILLSIATGTLALNAIDMRAPDVSEHVHAPDTEALAVRLQSCLQDAEPLPRDFRALFDVSMFSFSTDVMPAMGQLFADLGIKQEPLTLIPPQLEVPQPPLQGALFPPELQGPPAPKLDLFDLDDEFASERVRLAHVTNNCADDEGDLEFYIRECGGILGVSGKLPAEKRDAKHILEHVMRTLVHFKMRHQ